MGAGCSQGVACGVAAPLLLSRKGESAVTKVNSATTSDVDDASQPSRREVLGALPAAITYLEDILQEAQRRPASSCHELFPARQKEDVASIWQQLQPCTHTDKRQWLVLVTESCSAADLAMCLSRHLHQQTYDTLTTSTTNTLVPGSNSANAADGHPDSLAPVAPQLTVDSNSKPITCLRAADVQVVLYMSLSTTSQAHEAARDDTSRPCQRTTGGSANPSILEPLDPQTLVEAIDGSDQIVLCMDSCSQLLQSSELCQVVLESVSVHGPHCLQVLLAAVRVDSMRLGLAWEHLQQRQKQQQQQQQQLLIKSAADSVTDAKGKGCVRIGDLRKARSAKAGLVSAQTPSNKRMCVPRPRTPATLRHSLTEPWFTVEAGMPQGGAFSAFPLASATRPAVDLGPGWLDHQLRAGAIAQGTSPERLPDLTMQIAPGINPDLLPSQLPGSMTPNVPGAGNQSVAVALAAAPSSTSFLNTLRTSSVPSRRRSCDSRMGIIVNACSQELATRWLLEAAKRQVEEAMATGFEGMAGLGDASAAVLSSAAASAGVSASAKGQAPSVVEVPALAASAGVCASAKGQAPPPVVEVPVVPSQAGGAPGQRLPSPLAPSTPDSCSLQPSCVGSASDASTASRSGSQDGRAEVQGTAKPAASVVPVTAPAAGVGLVLEPATPPSPGLTRSSKQYQAPPSPLLPPPVPTSQLVQKQSHRGIAASGSLGNAPSDSPEPKHPPVRSPSRVILPPLNLPGSTPVSSSRLHLPSTPNLPTIHAPSTPTPTSPTLPSLDPAQPPTHCPKLSAHQPSTSHTPRHDDAGSCVSAPTTPRASYQKGWAAAPGVPAGRPACMPTPPKESGGPRATPSPRPSARRSVELAQAPTLGGGAAASTLGLRTEASAPLATLAALAPVATQAEVVADLDCSPEAHLPPAPACITDPARSLAVQRQASHLELLAQILHLGGQPLVAERAYLRAVHCHTACLGEAHPRAVGALRAAAECCACLGRHEEATTFHRRVWQLQAAQKGPRHPASLMAMLALGKALSQKGDHQAAIDVLSRASRALDAVLGRHDPSATGCLTQLAAELCHVPSGQQQRLQTLRELHARCAEGPAGAASSEGLASLHALASCLQSLGHSEEAERCWGEELQLLSQAGLPDSDPQAMAALQSLACCMYAKGTLDAALVLYERLAVAREAAYGANHPDAKDAQQLVKGVRAQLLRR